MHILAFLVIFWLGITHTSAEYILLEKGDAGGYHAVKINHPNVLDAVTVIQRYSWPTISMFFDTFEDNEKLEYLEALKIEHGVTRFINHQLQTKINGNYVVYFVPDALFELAALSRAPLLSQFNDEAWGLNESSLHSWEIGSQLITNNFNAALQTEQDANSTLQSVFQKKIFSNPKRSNQFFEMYLQAGEDLWGQIHERLKEEPIFDSDESLFIDTLSHDILSEIVKYFTQETKNNYIKIIEDKYPNEKGAFREKDQFGKPINYVEFVKEMAGGGRYAQGLLYPPSNNIDDPTSVMEEFILKSLKFAFEAERRNTFLLFRGGTKREVKVKGRYPLIHQKEPHNIADLGDIHSLPLAAELTVDHIQSLSFGNSLLAGSVFENARQTAQSGARVLDYATIRSILYGLEIPLVEYLTGNTKNRDGTLNLNHPRNLIYIAPLPSILALFAAGELFHSRTKFSRYLSNGTQKPFNEIDGLKLDQYNLLKVMENDEKKELGLFSSPQVTWDKDIVPHLARFIADHIIVFSTSLRRHDGRPVTPKEIESAQKGLFSMEYQGLADLAHQNHKLINLEEIISAREKLKKPLGRVGPGEAQDPIHDKEPK